MSRRWTLKEDRFLFAYYEVVGDFAGTHDLNRPKGAATRRVALLKRTGAWDALDAYEAALADYSKALGIFCQEEEL